MKERLIELLLTKLFMFSAIDCEKLADYLLDNGVVQLPCKIGDTVYYVQPYDTLPDKLIVEGSVRRIVHECENRIFVLTENGVWPSDEVFMSRRDAELHIETFIKKLKEMIE